MANDLQAVHQLLDEEVADALEARRRWLDWTILGYRELAELHQPPYGDRGIVESASDALVGLCGLVPLLGPFHGLNASVPEVGLYWAVSPARRRHGYATEAARALIAYAFGTLQLQRILATTTFDNAASIGVMRKLGMRIERNARSEPDWCQVVGYLERQR